MTESPSPADFDGEFGRAFDGGFPSLFRYLARLTGDAELAQDIAQETFVRLYQRGSFPDDVRGWLGAVATNLARDEMRTSRRRAALLEARSAAGVAGSESPEDDALAIERRDSVRSALAALPRRDREMLLLRHEGYSYREIAEAVGVAPGSVGTLLLRATAAFESAFLGRMGEGTA